MRLLIIGDTHIPRRATRIPEPLKRAIEAEEWDLVAFTGDLTTPKLIAWLEGLGRALKIVRGNMDYLDLPEHELFSAERLRFGLIHGDIVYPRGDIPQLTRVAKRMGVDVLLSGHTHSPFIVHVKSENVLHVNPGSLTGVWGGGGGSMIPSYAYLKVDGRLVEVCIVELRNGRLWRRCERYEL